MKDLPLQLADFRLTTAEILYHMPDHPHLLQTYVWQALDRAPEFPVLRRFLAFWEKNLEGKLHSVKVASVGLIQPAKYRAAGAYLTLQ
ncbi:MAG: Usg family protein [Rhodospirillaceae bacterium]|nr:Usg family protein [Rhodospirillaceae bacterium]